MHIYDKKKVIRIDEQNVVDISTMTNDRFVHHYPFVDDISEVQILDAESHRYYDIPCYIIADNDNITVYPDMSLFDLKILIEQKNKKEEG